MHVKLGHIYMLNDYINKSMCAALQTTPIIFIQGAQFVSFWLWGELRNCLDKKFYWF